MNTNRPATAVAAAWTAAAILACATPGTIHAQNTSSAAGTTPAAQNGSNEAVQLTPFDVKADSDKSYGALNSNSITGFDVQLDKLPLSADIFDQTFMKDVGATTVESMIQQYSAGAGFSAADPGGAAATQQPGDRNGNAYLTLRGFATPIQMRDGFMPVGSFGNPGSTGVGMTSNFDIDRVEIINGPQSLLYGGGGSGGVINITSKEARLGAPSFGSIEYMIDQYGSKLAQLDYGVGNDTFAGRFAFINQDIGNRRQNVGGPMQGDYAQFALHLLNTTFRLSMEETYFDRINSANPTMTDVSTDSRGSSSLHYLLYANEAGSTGPSGTYALGAIDNGLLNWGNVDSYEGWWASELTTNQFINLSADSTWAPWLATRFMVGYDDYRDDRVNNTFHFYAPGASGNTLSGWAAGVTPQDTEEPVMTKAIRFQALITKDLFDGKVHTQTIAGADSLSSVQGEFQYDYYQADSNFNVITTPGVTTNNGRTEMGNLLWSINNGPVYYPLFAPRASQVTINGVNYVRQLNNPVNPALISANDPLGVTLGGSNYSINRINNSGLFLVNYTQWLDGKLDTLMGMRYERAYFEDQNQGSATPPTNATRLLLSRSGTFDVGADYNIRQWLHPYVTISDSNDPPFSESANPLGVLPQVSHGLGEEVGFKLNNASGTLSGSLALYHGDSKNEQLTLSSTIENDVNPSGLNGRYNSPNQWVDVDKDSTGAQLTLTAAPTDAWRMRLSASIIQGTIKTTNQFAQVYNDQFYENASGDVTYADGTILYVNGAASSKTAAEVAPGSANAVPLTVALMSNPSSAYYATPALVSGAISSGSSAAKILTSPLYIAQHGSVLTGVTGLPISDIQLTGVATAGVITATEAGDSTTGYPRYSFSFTNNYSFLHGPFTGFNVGGTVSAGWKNYYYYYYADGVTPSGAGRTLFSLPSYARLDTFLGYTRKFHRVTFSTQLKVFNMFNQYKVVALPNENTGFTAVTGVNATFTAQPRSYTWTNTISF